MKKSGARKFPGKKRGNGWYACPCCGARVFQSKGAYEICSECQWEDDPIQAQDPGLKGGANRQSLREAKAAHLKKIKNNKT